MSASDMTAALVAFVVGLMGMVVFAGLVPFVGVVLFLVADIF